MSLLKDFGEVSNGRISILGDTKLFERSDKDWESISSIIMREGLIKDLDIEHLQKVYFER